MITFWTKTALHLITPGGFGYNRVLRNQQDPNFNIEKHKHPVRKKHHGQMGWQESQTTDKKITKRAYENYDEYTTHQKQKYTEILKSQGGFSNLTITRWRIRFYKRFRHITRLLPKKSIILCAGARQGTEVEVLRDLGYKNAYGIDLNPGPQNPFVKEGDFMHIRDKDNTIDLIYSNSIDHAIDLDAFFTEHKRVVKKNGYALYDIANYGDNREAGPFEAVSWESTKVVYDIMAKHFPKLVKQGQDKKWRWQLRQASEK